MGLLDWLGIANRARKPDVSAIEIERLGVAPQPLDRGAGLRESVYRVAEVEVLQAVGVVLAAGLGHTRPGTGADAESQPPVGHDVDGSGDLGQHRWRAETVAGDEQTEAQALVRTASAESSVQPSKIEPRRSRSREITQLLHDYGCAAVFTVVALQAVGCPLPRTTALVVGGCGASLRRRGRDGCSSRGS